MNGIKAKFDGQYRLISKSEVAERTHKLVLAAPCIADTASAGEFVMVEARGSFLRRPISLARACNGEIVLLVREFGVGSREICSRDAGDFIGISGPLGRGFPAVRGNVALVGGGIGVAPLLFANEQLGGAAQFVYGESTAKFVIKEHELPKNVCITTEDGSLGTKGNVCAAIDLTGIDVVFTCGPEPMLRAVVAMCKDAGVRVYASLEERMACGFGACVGCVVPTVDGYKKVCADGPVFDGAALFGSEN